MSIPFTQFLRPDGRQRATSIDRPAEVEGLAQHLRKVGVRFEVEELTTGEVSLEADPGAAPTKDVVEFESLGMRVAFAPGE